MRFFRLLILAAILAVIAFPLDLAYSAPGSTFTATSILDSVDAAPGDGVCADSIGTCTLRAAVMEANASAGPDTIELLADTYALTIVGVGEDDAAIGDLDLKGRVNINGADPKTTVIDVKQSGDRGFHIHSGANVTISGVTIQGSVTGNNDSDYPGGGLNNEGTLSLTNSKVSDNFTPYAGGIFNGDSGEIIIKDSVISGNSVLYGGGGIYNRGEMTLTNSTISDNFAGTVGGGIYNGGNLSITDSIVIENEALSPGGGIRNDGELTITNSTINENEALFGQPGGGISNFETGTVKLINSTISGNLAGSNGGGISNTDTGDVTIINSTISGNQANGSGGGIYNDETGTLDARNATIVSNTANTDGIGLSSNGGGIKNAGGTANLFNTILALNIHVIESGGFLAAIDDDCNGALNQLNYSLLTTTTGCTFTNDNSITRQNPKLDPLADNGGSTETRALKADSPAIDAGNPNGCKDDEGNDVITDQRGEIRPFDGDLDGTAVCDIGAYEFILYQQLTVNKIGTGDGIITSSPDGIDCGQDCSADLAQDTLVTLTAEPDADSTFSGWSGACSGKGECEITMDTAKTVTGTFTVASEALLKLFLPLSLR
jgi:hypothetical protein